jgi:hypothetical protein
MSLNKPRDLKMEVFLNDKEFSDLELIQHSGNRIPLFMTGHKNQHKLFK